MKNLEQIKKERLEQTRNKIEALSDVPEKGIKELLIGLHYLGIETKEYYEGHLDIDKGPSYPWVSIPFSFLNKLANLKKLMEILDSQNRPKLPDGKKNNNIWAWNIMKSESEFTLEPLNTNLPLEKLQEYAYEFGLFLQSWSIYRTPF